MGEHAPCRSREVIDPEMLIETVKSHRILYDTTEEDYGSNGAKNRAWESVAKKLGVRDKDVVRGKWKNLRDSYTKYLRSLDPEQVAMFPKYIERYRYWPWVKNMQFLLPFLDTAARVNIDMLNQPGSPHDEASSSSTERNIKRKKNIIPRELSKCPPTDTKLKQESKRNTEEKDVKADKLRDLSDLDHTDLIFLGYARTIKNMSVRRQASVKLGVAQLIMDAEIEQDEENNPQNYQIAVAHNFFTDARTYAGEDDDNQDHLSSQEFDTDDEKPIKIKKLD